MGYNAFMIDMQMVITLGSVVGVALFGALVVQWRTSRHWMRNNFV